MDKLFWGGFAFTIFTIPMTLISYRFGRIKKTGERQTLRRAFLTTAVIGLVLGIYVALTTP